MRDGSERLRQVLGAVTYDELTSTDGPVQYGMVADVMRGSDRLLASVPLAADWSFSWDSSAMVEVDGSVTVLHTDYDESGQAVPLDQAWIPRDPGDALSAFGGELVVSAWVSAGPFLERVQLGVFPIVATPDTAETWTNITGESRLLGETISLRLADRMDGVQRDRFTKVTGPRSSTCYDELERLTGRPAVRTLPNQNVSGIVAYEDDDRAKAVQQIARIIGGDAFFNSDGFLEVRPAAAPAASLTLTLGPYGRVASVSAPLSRDGVYNGAAVTGKDGLVYSEAWVDSGPLAPANYGRVPFLFKSDFIVTQAQADAYAKQLRDEKSRLRAQVVEVTCLWNPLVEVGDVVRVVEQAGSRLVRVTKISMGGPMMRITGTVVG